MCVLMNNIGMMHDATLNREFVMQDILVPVMLMVAWVSRRMCAEFDV